MKSRARSHKDCKTVGTVPESGAAGITKQARTDQSSYTDTGSVRGNVS